MDNKKNAGLTDEVRVVSAQLIVQLHVVRRVDGLPEPLSSVSNFLDGFYGRDTGRRTMSEHVHEALRGMSLPARAGLGPELGLDIVLKHLRQTAQREDRL